MNTGNTGYGHLILLGTLIWLCLGLLILAPTPMRFISLFPLSIFAFCFLMEIIFLLEDN